MTRVDFYILASDDPAERERFACRLIEKAWRRGNTVHVHVDSADAASHLDGLLWSFRADSFVPHQLAPAPVSTPVHVGWGVESGAHHEVLVNLAGDTPDFFSRFERLAEIVTQEPAQLARSRERFRLYRERGYPLETHKIG